MSKKEKIDFSGMSAKELIDMVRQEKINMYSLRVKKKFGELKDTKALSNLRKKIARIMTQLAKLSKEEA